MDVFLDFFYTSLPSIIYILTVIGPPTSLIDPLYTILLFTSTEITFARGMDHLI